MARILIAGCGDVGSRLGQLLAAEGHEVWGLKRHPVSLPPGIRPLAADLGDPASLTTLPARLDGVFYAVAAGGFSAANYQAAYVTGVNNLLAALTGAGQSVRRVLYVSSTSVYGQRQGEWIDETSPAEAAGFSGQSLREGEQSVWNSPYPAVAVRFAGIYGPGRTRLIEMLRAGEARCPTGVYSNRIHSDDCARVLKHLWDLPQPERLYIGVDNCPVLQCEVLDWLAERLGLPGPARDSASAGAEALLRGNKRCSNARLQASGFTLTYPSYREGYAALLA